MTFIVNSKFMKHAVLGIKRCLPVGLNPIPPKQSIAVCSAHLLPIAIGFSASFKWPSPPVTVMAYNN